MSDITTAVQFVLTAATEDDLGRIIDAVKSRRSHLRQVAAAAVTVGMATRLDGLSPKYLNGLTGEVVAIKGQRATVRLDASSTTRLSWNARYGMAVQMGKREDGTYDLDGLPLSTVRPA